MKTKLVLTLLLSFTILVSDAGAHYGAIVYSTGEGSFGSTGLASNWGTRSGAINAAIRLARDASPDGYLDGYRSYWWNFRGYNAAARGFNEDATFVKFGWSYGWRTANGSINAAMNKVYNYPYNREYVYGYTR